MTNNIGFADKILRIVIAILFTTLYITQTVGGALGTVLLLLGAVLLITSFINFCPLYAALGIKTCPLKK